MAPPRSADSHRLIVGIYTLTIFASAALLFVLQPMFARMALPLLGGSAAVWNTAVVFYQCVLLAGYAYAYALTRWISLRRQFVLHLAVLPLPLLVLPIDIPADWLPAVTAAPVLSLLALLSIAVGLPFFVVSTTSPLLQRWFVESGHTRAADPVLSVRREQSRKLAVSPRIPVGRGAMAAPQRSRPLVGRRLLAPNGTCGRLRRDHLEASRALIDRGATS